MKKTKTKTIFHHIYLNICHCHRSLIIIWDIIHGYLLRNIGTTLSFAFPTNWRTVKSMPFASTPCSIAPVLQSHLKTWMSFFGAGKMSVCIATMWPSTIFQPHSLGFRCCLDLSFHSSYLEKNSKGVVFHCCSSWPSFLPQHTLNFLPLVLEVWVGKASRHSPGFHYTDKLAPVHLLL